MQSLLQAAIRNIISIRPYASVYKISACNFLSVKSYANVSKNFQRPGASEQRPLWKNFQHFHFLFLRSLLHPSFKEIAIILFELFKIISVSTFSIHLSTSQVTYKFV